MFLAFPQCNTWKCEKCHNADLRHQLNIEVAPIDLVFRYLQNPLSEAIVFGGLEPLDTFTDVLELVSAFRKGTQDPIIIYTGYEREEITNMVEDLSQYSNIIMKFGRYLPDYDGYTNLVLGVRLASANQRAEKIS